MNHLFWGVYLFSMIVNLATYSYIIATNDAKEIEKLEEISKPLDWIYIGLVLSVIPMANIAVSQDCFSYFLRKINQ